MGQNGRKAHDDASYRQRRRQLMESIGPNTRCGRCGKLFHQHPPHGNGKPGRWEVGHALDAVTHGNLGPLRIEHSVCNRRAGGQLGYRRGIGRQRANASTGARYVGPHHPMHYALDPHAPTAPPCVRVNGKLCETCAEWRARS
jgi:hypothetical protein